MRLHYLLVGLLACSAMVAAPRPADAVPVECVAFTDDLTVDVTPVKAVHVTELRACVNGQRAEILLAPVTWAEEIVAGSTPVRASHLVELRQAITAVYQLVNQVPPTFTDTLEAGVPIKRVHVQELRNAARNLVIPLAPTPGYSPSSGIYHTPQTVSLSGSGQIRYTLDGSIPTPSSPLYTGTPIAINDPKTLRLRQFMTDHAPSPVVTAVYALQVGPPVLTPPPGIYAEPRFISAVTVTPQATLRYTTDGSDPTVSSPIFPVSPATLPLGPPSTTVIKIRGFKTGWPASEIVRASFTFDQYSQYILDRFYGSGSLVGHPPDIAPGSSAWVQIGGDPFALSSNSFLGEVDAYVNEGGTPAAVSVTAINSELSEAQVRVDVSSASAAQTAGIAFRVVNVNNMMAVRHRSINNNAIAFVDLMMLLNGAWTTLASAEVQPIGDGYRGRLEARFSAARVQVLWNGVVKIDRHVPEYPHQAAMYHGLIGWGSDTEARWDNFEVLPAADRPFIVGPGELDWTEGTEVSTQISAVDPLGEQMTYSWSIQSLTGNTLSSVTLNPNTGTIVGDLTHDSTGFYNVTLTARAGTRVGQRTFKWLVMCPWVDYELADDQRMRTLLPGGGTVTWELQGSEGCAWRPRALNGGPKPVGAGIGDGIGEWLPRDSFQVEIGNNPSPWPGTAMYAVGHRVVAVQILGENGESCTPSLSPNPPNATYGFHADGSYEGAAGYLATVSFTFAGLSNPPPGDCSWSVANSVPWVHIVGPTSGVGDGSFQIRVDRSNGAYRRTTLAINNLEIRVEQQTEGCTDYTVSPNVISAPASGGTFPVWLQTSCNGWNANLITPGADQFMAISPTFGNGSGWLNIGIGPNTTPFPRGGAFLVGDELINVTQAGYDDADDTLEPSTEDVSYFYTDALGSVRAMTDRFGTLRARRDYGPFGIETYTDNGHIPSQKQFTGQERDAETAFGGWQSFDYFMARYYDPGIGRFSRPDDPEYGNPFAPQSMNLYTYVLNNPLTFTDPDGHECDPMTGIDLANGGAACGVVTVPAPKPVPTKPVTPWQLGWEWLTGRGPRERKFTDADAMTRQLKSHVHIQQVAAAACSGAIEPAGQQPYRLRGLEGVPKYVKDYSTLTTAGRTGNLAVTYLGSYGLSYSKSDGHVNMTVTNSSTIASGLRPPVIGYTATWDKYVGRPMNEALSSGPMSRTTQTFDFSVQCQ